MNWVKKLTSRKLWMAIAEFVGMLMVAFNAAESEVTQVTALIMSGAGVVAYIIAEGWADAGHIDDNKEEE